MEKYGLLGYPLGHSFSRGFFNEKFANEHIDAEYLNFEIADIDEVRGILAEYPNLHGLNVTIPYKEKILPYLDELTPEAKAIGAVNVIQVTHRHNKIHLKGFNSDVIGFSQSIEPLLELHDKKALILGTGGASKAVRYGLQKLGLEYQLVSRHRNESCIQYEDITAEMLQEYTVIVNCTPLGMYPKVDACPAIPYEGLGPKHLLYDLLYNPDTTLFMSKGHAQGARTKNGLEMLILQARAAWEFWHS